MNQFFLSFIFIGIILVIFSLIMILLDKKKVFSFFKDYEDKKQELVEIINDAEQMIEELNKFSDYIVTQMDFKNEELSLNLKKAEDQIKSYMHKANEICNNTNELPAGVKSENNLSQNSVPNTIFETPIAMSGNMYEPGTAYTEPVYKYGGMGSEEKVISINAKHNEVVRLARSGLSVVEIAKKLNMGKGEIQLILQLNK